MGHHSLSRLALNRLKLLASSSLWVTALIFTGCQGGAGASSVSDGSSGPNAQATPGPQPTACSAGTTICVGANQATKTLTAALAKSQAGSVIELLGGTYKETMAISLENITIRGAKGAQVKIDCSGMRPAQSKACIVASANNLTIENLVITGAKGDQQNEACLRNEPSKNVTVRNVECYGSYNGILTAPGGSWIVEDSYFHDNGFGDGYTHNLYFGDCTELTLRRVISKNAIGGHALKSRCAKSLIEDSQLFDSADANAADFPNGGDVVIRRSTLAQPNGSNGYIARHGEEGCTHSGHLVFESSTIINERSMGYIMSACSSLVFTNTVVPANVTIQQP